MNERRTRVEDEPVNRKTLSVPLVAALALVAFGIAGAASPQKRVAQVAPARADSTLGLSHTSVFTVPVPRSVRPEASSPGDRPRRARANPVAPPQVPHGVADFVPIRPGENQCVDCHSKAGAKESGAVPVPNSHYTDLRNAPGRMRDTIAGARYVCLSCHPAGSDAPPLVPNGSGR